MGRVFTNGPGDRGPIPGQVIPKTLKKKVLHTSFLNTQHYKVCIKGKVEQSRGRKSTLDVVAIEKGALESPSTTVANFTLPTYVIIEYFLCASFVFHVSILL